jgi:adenylate kinase
MNLKTIIFTGRSGCGKGTQAEMIKKYLAENDYRKTFHLESGERFRKFIKGESYSSYLSKKIAEEGGLQPEFLSTWVWSSEMIENLQEDMHILLDGTPRRLAEAKVLESAFDFFERPKVDIVYINVSKEWSIQKLQSRGRADDIDINDVLERMKWFETDVVPAIDYYRLQNSHNFHEINGEQDIDTVHQDILKSVFND